MSSLLYKEIGQIAASVEHVLLAELPELPPRPDHLYCVARGSSLHASAVIHHLMRHASIPSSSLSPNLLQAGPILLNSVVLAVSQSGASPDLCTAARACLVQNCPVVALVNMPNSTLERLASSTLHQHAGEEKAVAATKSMVCSVIMGARLAMHWGAPDFNLDDLSDQIMAIQQQEFGELLKFLSIEEPLLIIGGGSAYGVAAEVALKAQELLGRASMAYSPAEVLHGPAGMIREDYPVLVLATGPEKDAALKCAQKLVDMGALIHTVSDTERQDDLAPLLSLSRIYQAMEAACRRLGRSPDQPVNLSKVTLTE